MIDNPWRHRAEWRQARAQIRFQPFPPGEAVCRWRGTKSRRFATFPSNVPSNCLKITKFLATPQTVSRGPVFRARGIISRPVAARPGVFYGTPPAAWAGPGRSRRDPAAARGAGPVRAGRGTASARASGSPRPPAGRRRVLPLGLFWLRARPLPELNGACVPSGTPARCPGR